VAVFHRAKERNAMKALRFALMALAVLALTFAVGGCNIFINLFDGAPSVTLSAPKTVLNSGEIVALTASVSHGSAPLTYKWEEDGVDVLVNSPEYAYSKFVTSSKDITMKVTVTDADGRTGSATKIITVVRPSSSVTIHIVNSSSYDAYYLYVSPASNGNWGPDQLRPDIVIYAGGWWDLNGVPAGNWDLKIVSINRLHTWTALSQPVAASGTYIWTLTNSNWD
jgi:hypothetical protein